MKNIILALSVMSLVGCASLNLDTSKAKLGMYEGDVRETLGNPDYTKTVDGDRVLVYAKSKGDHWVVLHDGKVSYVGPAAEYKKK